MFKDSTLALAALGAVCAWAAPASAQLGMGPIPGEERFQQLAESQEGTSGSAGAMLGFGQIEEDYFLNISPRLDLNFGKVGLGLQVPLRLRIIDKDPENNDDVWGVLRKEDWDEVSDYFRIIRYLRFGRKGDKVYVRIGELAAQIGHGTIMSRYINNMDLDVYRLGLQLDVNTDYGGVETVIGDLGNLFKSSDDSKVVGMRAYVKPVAFADPESAFNIFAVGITYITDATAPLQLATDPVTGVNVVNDDDNFVVDESAAQSVVGFDLEAKVLDTSILKITPYSDTNFITKAGVGWHLGVLVDFNFDLGISLRIPVRLEYRRFKNNYQPIYFSTFYELERFQFPLGTNGVPTKARAIRDAAGGSGRNGYYADLALDFSGLVQIGGVYEDYKGGPGDMMLFLSIPALDAVQFKAFYARTGIQGKGDIFALDDRSMAVAQARFRLFYATYLVGRWTRRWVLQEDPADMDFGNYEAVDSWNAGVEISFEF